LLERDFFTGAEKISIAPGEIRREDNDEERRRRQMP
jgi:hypothetical protein